MKVENFITSKYPALKRDMNKDLLNNISGNELVSLIKEYLNTSESKNDVSPDVSKSFTAEFVVNELEQCDTLDDAIMYFKQQM